MVVETVMEIFTFMKDSMFQKDDCYTYELITKTIQTILPTLFSRSVSLKFLDFFVVV